MSSSNRSTAIIEKNLSEDKDTEELAKYIKENLLEEDREIKIPPDKKTLNELTSIPFIEAVYNHTDFFIAETLGKLALKEPTLVLTALKLLPIKPQVISEESSSNLIYPLLYHISTNNSSAEESTKEESKKKDQERILQIIFEKSPEMKMNVDSFVYEKKLLDKPLVYLQATRKLLELGIPTNQPTQQAVWKKINSLPDEKEKNKYLCELRKENHPLRQILCPLPNPTNQPTIFEKRNKSAKKEFFRNNLQSAKCKRIKRKIKEENKIFYYTSREKSNAVNTRPQRI